MWKKDLPIFLRPWRTSQPSWRTAAGAGPGPAEAPRHGARDVGVVEERGRGVLRRGHGARERAPEDAREGVQGVLGAVDGLRRRVVRHRCREEGDEDEDKEGATVDDVENGKGRRRDRRIARARTASALTPHPRASLERNKAVLWTSLHAASEGRNEGRKAVQI